MCVCVPYKNNYVLCTTSEVDKRSTRTETIENLADCKHKPLQVLAFFLCNKVQSKQIELVLSHRLEMMLHDVVPNVCKRCDLLQSSRLFASCHGPGSNSSGFKLPFACTQYTRWVTSWIPHDAPGVKVKNDQGKITHLH